MNKNSLIALGVFIVLSLIVLSLVPPRTQAPEQPVAAELQQIVVEGEYLCLPHADTSGPQTEECAIGIRTDDGTMAALDLNQLTSSDVLATLASGDRILVTGTFTPIEALSTDQWQTYDIVGILSVTSLEKTGIPS